MLRWAIVSDWHVPKHDKRKVALWFKIMKEWKPDFITVNGDFDDFEAPSRWVSGTPTEYTERVAITTETVSKKILREIREDHPNAEIDWLDGNHEFRLEDYVAKNAPALVGSITIPKIFDLDNLGIEHQPYGAPPKKKFGGYYVHHGTFISKNAGESVKKEIEHYGVSIIMGHCFDDKTEILTPTGWKRYTEINVGEPVLTLDTNSTKDHPILKWDTVNELHIYDNYKELIRLDMPGAALDLLVTDKHGLMLPPNSKRATWERVAAEDMFGKEFRDFPLAGFHDEESLPLNDSQVRVLAWIIAEGSISENPGGHIRIAQSDHDGHLEALEADLEGAGIKFSKTLRYRAGTTAHGQHRNYDAYRYGLSSRQSDLSWVYKYIDRDKTILPALSGMSVAQMRTFLDTFCIADGNQATPNSRQLSSSREDHIDFLQEIAVRSGFRSTKTSRPNGMWTLTVNSRMSARVRPENWSVEEYDGKVWCVSVDAGTLVVRRNGKTAITANTHRLGSHKISYLDGRVLRGYEGGHMTDLKQMDYAPFHNWQHGFLTGYIDGSKCHMIENEFIGNSIVFDGVKYEA
jgi:hypothetical protein